ncbi:asparagine--tRNA ligase [Lyngbya confervoides]|uniref:Asparagine--tRNA ligase n=1 Tax=Lyngbya confervoides BDU141951 TaxID=1574623 RepID=A0ABD4T7P4_9CYAN|nr:asparagine--tRNA ligase [Lyngbya confervoides]MCM1984566.1 asparagine--tRNA ligase [Lyngbya confervoides BDU141951]
MAVSRPPSIRSILNHGQPGDAVMANGWVRSKRVLKGFAFLDLNDGSSMQGLQVVLDEALPAFAAQLNQLGTGASVTVHGDLVASQGKNQRIELKATSLQVWGTADPQTYPLQKKRHSFEFLRTIAHLRSRTNTLGAVFRVRNACSHAIHQFFQEQGFLWVHTPIITHGDCEGAGEQFSVTALDLHHLPLTAQQSIDWSQDFFGQPTYLTVSGQLEAEIMAMAFTHVYTFGPTFRAENSNTSRHLAEFWMVEPEMAFCNLQGDMDWAESFLKFVFRQVLEQCADDFEFFNQRIDSTVLETAQLIIDQPFERMTYTEAINRLEQCDRSFEFPVAWGIDLQSEHERYLTEDLVKRPVIVTDYPKDIKAFYMRLNEDLKTVAAMDILVPKIGELVGGSQREERLEVLQARMQETNLPGEDYWWYLDLRRYGTVPHAGFGLGFERLVQFMTGMQNIRDVIPFPRTPMSADF